MSVDVRREQDDGVVGVAPAAAEEVARSQLAVLTRTAASAARSGALWGLVFGAYVAAQAAGYVGTYKTLGERAALASGFGSGGLDALFGRPRQMQTVAGYTAWKSLGVLVVVGALWALAASTKALRGEEDSGRWELLLSGRTTPRRAALQTVVGLLAGFMALFAVTATAVLAIGASRSISFRPAASVFFALATVAGAAMFLAVGTLLSEVAPTRQQAFGYGALVLMASFAVRSVSDMDAHLEWVSWLTPLGWIERLDPFTGSYVLPLVPIGALAVVVTSAAVRVAGTRDLGASVLSDHDTAEPRFALLGGAGALSVRMALGTISAWTFAAIALGLLLGGETHLAVKSLDASPAARRALTRLGGSGTALDGYLSAALLLTALLGCLAAAAQVAAGRREEALGRLDRVLVGSVSRTRWWLGRTALAAAAAVLVCGLGGCSVWLGASAHSLPSSGPSLLEAVINTIPPALCVTGVGMLALAVVPRWAAMVGYGWVGWSLLLALFGDVTGINHWLLDTSVLHQMSLAPAHAPDWTTALVLTVVGAVTAGVGAAIFGRRDLVDE